MRLVWLRRDLRTTDNTALNRAIESGGPIVALYIATPGQWRSHYLAPIQADLIWRRLGEMNQELSQLNIPLLYAETDDFSAVTEVLDRVVQAFPISEVLANREYELNEVRRDRLAGERLSRREIPFHLSDDKCIIPPGAVLTRQGHYFKVFTPFKKAWLAGVRIPQILKTGTAAKCLLTSEQRQWCWYSEVTFSYPRENSCRWPADFPSIRQQLRDFCQDKADHYQTERDIPALDATSRLSSYLAIGALSARQCMVRLYQHSDNGILSDGEQTWLNELIWREFYQHLIASVPALSQGKDFLPWGAFLPWWEQPEYLSAWQEGKTGYPIVDAAMRQLNQTGWMHNRLRMIAASFLIKDLHIDWREGETYFMSRLIDGDYAANNGGWQWCASTGCDGQPYFRIFNPVSQGEKFDPDGTFVRRWIPELAGVPARYIHKPWLWSGVSGVSYPQPIVDHKTEREITLRQYQEAKDKN